MWIERTARKWQSHNRAVARAHALDLKMASLILHNGFCHSLKVGDISKLDVVGETLSASRVTEEAALTRFRLKEDVAILTDLMIQTCIHGHPDRVVPCTAVATKTRTALEIFRNKNNIAKDHAIELVTKIYDIDWESRSEVKKAAIDKKQSEKP